MGKFSVLKKKTCFKREARVSLKKRFLDSLFSLFSQLSFFFVILSNLFKKK